METKISLNQIGLYNPKRQSAVVTEKLFSVRQKHFELLLNKILLEKENSIPQHYLIIGQRGMGKTSMLKILDVELHKEQYRQQFIPLLFSEEQYNVKDLSDFWLNSLYALANSLEYEKSSKEILTTIDKKIKEFREKFSEKFSEDIYKFLMNTCRDIHRRPVLLIDNIGLVFSRLNSNGKNKQEQFVLRKILSENGAPIVISTGITVTDDVINYDMPFYDFFQIQYLKKLNFEDFSSLLNNLATVTNSDDIVIKSLQRNASRQKSLLELAGGSPRIAAMLFKYIVKGFSNNINDDLEALADEITPIYKANFEKLPTQQQLILHAIAMNWDAIPLRKLSAKTGLQNNQLSPQLKRLIEEGWIETTPAYKAKGNAYFINDRFFNIWYLLRNSTRRHKEKIHCLSKFLEYFYEQNDLESIPDDFFQRDISHQKEIMPEYALSETIEKGNLKKEFDKTSFTLIQKGLSYFDNQKYDKAIECYDKVVNLLNLTDKEGVNQNKNTYFVYVIYLHKALFQLYKQNKGIATDCLLQAFNIIEKAHKLSSIANDYWWMIFGGIVINIEFGEWLIVALKAQGYNIKLSPYYTAIKALELERQEGTKIAEIYLKNRAVEISEPARLIINKMRKHLNFEFNRIKL